MILQCVKMYMYVPDLHGEFPRMNTTLKDLECIQMMGLDRLHRYSFVVCVIVSMWFI
jgi:hypothetical protein